MQMMSHTLALAAGERGGGDGLAASSRGEAMSAVPTGFPFCTGLEESLLLSMSQAEADALKQQGARHSPSLVPCQSYLCVLPPSALSGNDKLKEGALSEAIDLYTAAIAAFPTSPTVHVLYSNRSAAYARMDDHEKALEDARCRFHAWLALHLRSVCRPVAPPSSPPLFLRESVRITPSFAKGHSRIGTSLFNLGRCVLSVEGCVCSECMRGCVCVC